RRSKLRPRSTSMLRPLCVNTLIRSRTLTAAPRRTPSREFAVGAVVMGCAKVVGAPGGVNDAMGPETPRLRRVTSGLPGRTVFVHVDVHVHVTRQRARSGGTLRSHS